ncbi:hypothetical protein HYW42_04985 [Candidatus Daviesbacteria bacterium]|nr:hypothetical protein [Candidatus Daviesbacteria bacterium]
MVSYGSFIPTHERLMFDLDRKRRLSGTHVFSIDHQALPISIISGLTDGKASCSFGLNDGNCQSSHEFVNVTEEAFNPGLEVVDMIWNFRASLYYYLQAYYRLAQELVGNAGALLEKYHRELRSLGSVVVDAADIPGKSPGIEMYKSTAELIEDFREELGIDALFNTSLLGQNQDRVMILKKKSNSTPLP